jgi:hemerythrin-like domain-containing protein
MKRGPGLIQLSREHHLALVLAKRMQRIDAGTAGDIHGFVAAARKTFAEEIDPHFQTEEAVLLPALKVANEHELVSRTVSEHANLRALIRDMNHQDVASLQRFGDALEAHVRFEERILFPAAEAVLTPEVLAAVQHHAEQRAVPGEHLSSE